MFQLKSEETLNETKFEWSLVWAADTWTKLYLKPDIFTSHQYFMITDDLSFDWLTD